MVVRIHNLDKWARLEPGEAISLKGSQFRKIRVDVNCPAPTRFDVVDGDVTTFLAVVTGFETLEFSASADAYIVPTSEDEVFFFTNEGDNPSIDNPHAVSFTTIANRQTRNPELELMMYKATYNANKRNEYLEQQLQSMSAAISGLQVNGETGEVHATNVGAGDGASGSAAAAGAASGAAAEPDKGKAGSANA